MIAAGFGYRTGAGCESFVDALGRALARAGRAAPGPGLIAVPADKAAEPGLLALAARLGLPVAQIPPDALGSAPTLTQSPASLAARGTGSVCEAAALAAAGPGARLLGPRVFSSDRMAGCALAEGPIP